MNSLRTAVIGVGNMGTAHAMTLENKKIQGMQLTALCDNRPERIKSLRTMFPNLPVYARYEEMVEKESLDAVIIAVPHPLHASIATYCLNRGLHVLTEKPIDILVSRAQLAVDAARRAGKVFAIMFNQRTNPLFQKARDIVRSGEMGELKRTVWIITNWYRSQSYYDSGSWRATWSGEGGGVLLNQAPHNLDLWQWICGMPQEVTAFCDVARYHHIEVEDDATIMTRYAGGASGIFITSTGEYPGTNRLEISGDKGKLVLEGGKLRWWKLQQSEHDVRFHSPVSFPSIPMDETEFVPDSVPDGHMAVLQNFSDAILHGEKLLSPGEDGINELMLSNAAYLSQWLENRTVNLPIDHQLFEEKLHALQKSSTYRERTGTESPDGSYSSRWQTNW